MHVAALTVALAGTMGGLVPTAVAPATEPRWMNEEAMRAAFIGKTLDGHYSTGVTMTETYHPEGRLEYREKARDAKGYWYFRNGNVFCTFYDPAYRMNGGCWTVIKASANCYEFYLSGLREPGTEPRGDERWQARGWRRGEPSTCEEKPSV
jgi:hypothetical protein